MLAEAADLELLLLAAELRRAELGAADALDLVQRLGPDAARTGADRARLAELERGLYRAWLEALLAAASSNTRHPLRTSAAARFPDDAAIHLAGVELALLTGDWWEAERLLLAREYPAALADRAQVLAGRIAALKRAEGQIVIQFPPGSLSIPTTAEVNGRLRQPFLVDTGASTSMLPRAAADRLGIRITSATPRATVQPVGEPITVPVLTVDSITLQGWEVRNVEVIVYDFPAESDWHGYGLLGLNFLNQFRMDLDSERGSLILEPR